MVSIPVIIYWESNKSAKKEAILAAFLGIAFQAGAELLSIDQYRIDGSP